MPVLGLCLYLNNNTHMSYPKMGENAPETKTRSNEAQPMSSRRDFLKKMAGLVGAAAIGQITGACDERGCQNYPARQNPESCTPSPSSGIIKKEVSPEHCKPWPESCKPTPQPEPCHP